MKSTFLIEAVGRARAKKSIFLDFSDSEAISVTATVANRWFLALCGSSFLLSSFSQQSSGLTGGSPTQKE